VLAVANFGLGACWQGTYLGNLEGHAKVIKGMLEIARAQAKPKKPLEDLVHFEEVLIDPLLYFYRIFI